MNTEVTRIRELVEPLFAGGVFDEPVYLVDLQVRGQQGSKVVSVLADTEAGISLGEITRLTREINDLLDVHDVIAGKYRLEVSSPGVSRSLTDTWEFRKNISRNLRVVYEEENTEQTEIIGKLLSVDEAEIVLQLKKESLAIPRETIRKAFVQLKW